MPTTVLKRMPSLVFSFEYIYEFFIASFHICLGSQTFYKMVALKIQRETPVLESFLNKVKYITGFVKKGLPYQCFPVTFAKLLSVLSFTEHLQTTESDFNSTFLLFLRLFVFVRFFCFLPALCRVRCNLHKATLRFCSHLLETIYKNRYRVRKRELLNFKNSTCKEKCETFTK